MTACTALPFLFAAGYYAWLAEHHAIFFFFNDTATTEIYTLSLHDALPIYNRAPCRRGPGGRHVHRTVARRAGRDRRHDYRSEEHTSELQSRPHLVCRLLLEKKKIARLIIIDVNSTFKEVAWLVDRQQQVAV